MVTASLELLVNQDMLKRSVQTMNVKSGTVRKGTPKIVGGTVDLKNVSNCAYKHKDKYEAKQLMEISKKIRVCEEQIIEKEKEIEAQEKRILQLESEIKTKELEEKVVILEKFVLSLEEKVELLEQDRKREPETGYVYPSR